VRAHLLQKRIWEDVTERLLNEYELEPTEAEVAALKALLLSMESQRLDQLEVERAEILEKLSSDILPANERPRLDERLASLEERIATEQALRKQSAAVPGDEEAQHQAVESVARMTVRNWKVNKALYEKYGGRVIFQQAGNEPIDAYRALIEELDKTNAIEILDPAFPAPFASLRAHFELRHHYTRPTPEPESPGERRHGSCR
jgi:hypothetical protein